MSERDIDEMHLKSGIFGLSNIKVVTDAGNWTYSAMGSGASGFSMNCESLLFIESGKLDKNETGERYLAEFMRVLRKYGDQNPDQPAVEQTIAQLQKLPNWPTIILPEGSAISGKASPCSRMPGDMAVRTRVASISIRALRSAFCAICRAKRGICAARRSTNSRIGVASDSSPASARKSK